MLPFRICRAVVTQIALRNSSEEYLRSYKAEIKGVWDRLDRALNPNQSRVKLQKDNFDMLPPVKRVLSRLNYYVKDAKDSKAKNAVLQAELEQAEADVNDLKNDSIELPYGLKFNLNSLMNSKVLPTNVMIQESCLGNLLW